MEVFKHNRGKSTYLVDRSQSVPDEMAMVGLAAAGAAGTPRVGGLGGTRLGRPGARFW